MRRPWIAALTVLTALMLLLPVGPAVGAADDLVLLATEGGGELPGQAPPPANSPDNPNPPDAYEAPVTQNAAPLLLGIMLIVVLAGGGLYYLLVERPRATAGK